MTDNINQLSVSYIFSDTQYDLSYYKINKYVSCFLNVIFKITQYVLCYKPGIYVLRKKIFKDLLLYLLTKNCFIYIFVPLTVEKINTEQIFKHLKFN